MKIGAQLYTVREFTQTAKDFADTIKKLANIGYEYVKVSGIGPIPFQEVADICKANGISVPITHANPTRIRDETEQVIAEHRILGADYVGIGGMHGDYERNAEGVKRFMADFTPAVEKIHAAGMTFMYHNHAHEFEKFGSKYMMEYLMEGLPQIGFTLDTYWVQTGGADPSAWIKKLSKRVDVVHLKDMAYTADKQMMAVPMEGNLNWDGIFAACRAAGVKYAMVELDDCYGADPFECLRRSYVNLKGAQ